MWIDDLFGIRIQVNKHTQNEFPSSNCILLRTWNGLKKIYLEWMQKNVLLMITTISFSMVLYTSNKILLIDLIILWCMYPILYRRVLLLESTDVSSLDGLHVLKYIKCVLPENNLLQYQWFFRCKKKVFHWKRALLLISLIFNDEKIS